MKGLIGTVLSAMFLFFSSNVPDWIGYFIITFGLNDKIFNSFGFHVCVYAILSFIGYWALFRFIFESNCKSLLLVEKQKNLSLKRKNKTEKKELEKKHKSTLNSEHSKSKDAIRKLTEKIKNLESLIAKKDTVIKSVTTNYLIALENSSEAKKQGDVDYNNYANTHTDSSITDIYS